MKIAIAGMSGLVGGSLAIHLSKKGHQIISVQRKHFLLSNKELAKYLEGCEAVYNFAGAPVIKRWTKRYKEEIKKSRVHTTRHLVDTMAVMESKPTFFFNASAIGFYDDIKIHTELSSDAVEGFLAQVVQLWEEEAHKAVALGIRTVIGRIGVVMSLKGGALPQLVKPYYFGLGGMLGFGRQAVSFIHIKDLVSALAFLGDNSNASGVYNLVAPRYCTNREMAQVIGIFLHKPAFLRIPYFIIYLLYGEAGKVVIGGEKVIPERLNKLDFQFYYPDIYATLSDLLE